MESVSLPHPDVWATKISSIPITVRMGMISSLPIALRMGPHAQNHALLHNLLAPCWLCMHLVYKGVGTP